MLGTGADAQTTPHRTPSDGPFCSLVMLGGRSVASMRRGRAVVYWWCGSNATELEFAGGFMRSTTGASTRRPPAPPSFFVTAVGRLVRGQTERYRRRKRLKSTVSTMLTMIIVAIGK
jgi:hypothetical protein